MHFILASISLLHEKRKELGDAASKLRNGLDKIDDTRAKVQSFVVQFYLTDHEIGFIFLWGNIVKYFSMEKEENKKCAATKQHNVSEFTPNKIDIFSE